MTEPAATLPVVVGVDGSDAAFAAALWAADEAADRKVPLRLVRAIGAARDRSILFDFYRPEIGYGEGALRSAASAVAATGKNVKVETDKLWGSPDTALIAESQAAAMLCVGSAGIAWVAGRMLGPTASTVAEKAGCTVVIVPRQTADVAAEPPNWIAVAVDNLPGNDLVMARALEEARLREAPVLAVGRRRNAADTAAHDELDRRVTGLRRTYSDVHIYRCPRKRASPSSSPRTPSVSSLPSSGLATAIKFSPSLRARR